MLSADQDSIDNYAEALSFHSMANHADVAGQHGVYSGLRPVRCPASLGKGGDAMSKRLRQLTSGFSRLRTSSRWATTFAFAPRMTSTPFELSDCVYDLALPSEAE